MAWSRLLLTLEIAKFAAVALEPRLATRPEQLLHNAVSSNGSSVSVWLVQLPEGNLEPADYIVACDRIAAKPVCEGDQACVAADQHCLALRYEQPYCGKPMSGLVQQIQNTDESRIAEQLLRHACNYEGSRPGLWQSGACLVPSPFDGSFALMPANNLIGPRYAVCAGLASVSAPRPPPTSPSTSAQAKPSPRPFVVPSISRSPSAQTTPSPGAFVVRSGACVVDGACVMSPGFPGYYPNGAGCAVVAERDGVLDVQHFDTQPERDVLTLHNVSFSGLDGPNRQQVATGDVLSWVSDAVESASGWRLCLRPEASAEAMEVEQLRREEQKMKKEIDALRSKANDADSQAAAKIQRMHREEADLRQQEASLRDQVHRDDMERSAMVQERDQLWWLLVLVVICLMLISAAVLAHRLLAKATTSPLGAPLLSVESSGSSSSGPRDASFQPQVSVVSYRTLAGMEAKCVRVLAPGRHMVSGCRTIRGTVQELTWPNCGVHLKLIKEPDIPEQLAPGVSNIDSNAGGVWEHTVQLEGHWQVLDPTERGGQAFDDHGVWQIHLIKRESRTLSVCPSVSICENDAEMPEDVEAYDDRGMQSSVSQPMPNAHLDDVSWSGGFAGVDTGGDITQSAAKDHVESAEPSADFSWLGADGNSIEAAHATVASADVVSSADFSWLEQRNPRIQQAFIGAGGFGATGSGADFSWLSKSSTSVDAKPTVQRHVGKECTSLPAASQSRDLPPSSPPSDSSSEVGHSAWQVLGDEEQGV